MYQTSIIFMKTFNKAIRILLFTNGFTLLAAAMIGPIYALFVESVGGNLLDASLTGAAFAFAAGITLLVFGKITDKIKRKYLLIVIGYALMGFGYLAFLWVDSMFTLLMVQILIGIGGAIYAPAFDALYSLNLNRKREGFGWGTWEAMSQFAVAIGSIMGGLVATYYGFPLLFLAMATLCFVSAIYVLLTPKSLL